MWSSGLTTGGIWGQVFFFFFAAEGIDPLFSLGLGWLGGGYRGRAWVGGRELCQLENK